MYPKQKWDVPYGRLQQTPQQSGFFAAATPGSANPAAFWGGETQAAQPGEAVTFSHSAGSYTEPFVLQMEASDEAAIILYTLYVRGKAVTNNNGVLSVKVRYS